MQKKDYEDFDLQIRSSLEGAEEQVPSRIWSGISSRLDAIDAAKAPVHSKKNWGWAAAGMAVAAALATGIFFKGTSDHNSNLINNNENGLTALVDPVLSAVPETPATEESDLPQDILPEVQKAEKPARVAQNQTIKPTPKVNVVAEGLLNNTKVEEKAESSEEVAPNEVREEAATEKAPAKEVAEPSKAEPTSDPFAEMAFEDSKKTHRFHTSAYAGGSISGNNAGTGAVAMGVSGSSLNVLQETSKSTYGIPLTIGAGVRFHFAPRWSVGTGLDYSLLTRTFTGAYGNEQIINSDIRHTVQYLGVPLNLYFDIINSRRVSFYVFGGGEAEFCVANKYKVLESGDVLKESVKKPQYSIGSGLGLEFKLGNGVGLYLDPSARYYFDCEQPKSIRTEKPFMINFNAGLRFNF